MILRRLLNATGALMATAALVVVVPVGLWVNVGWPLPTAVPSLDEIQMGLRSGIDPQFLIKSLAVIVWVVWAQLVAALTVEVAAVARGHATRRLPILPGLQQTAARLVAAFAVVAATAAPIKAAPAVPLTPVATVEAMAYPQPLEVSQRSNPSTAGKVRPVRYTTQRFDTLWGIAEQTLGDGRRWQEIRTLNPDHIAADGTVDPGVTLDLPADATAPPEETTPGQVTVKAGDSFWTIAETALTQAGDRSPDDAEIASYWRQVIDTNRNRLAPPHDPDVIYPGQVFDLPIPPDVAEVPMAGVDRERIVVVERGDSLWSIARQALSEAWDRSPTDSETNRLVQELIDRNRLEDPNLIHPGDTFQMPAIPGDTAVTHLPPPETEEPSGDLEPEPTQPADQAPEQPNDSQPDNTPTTAATPETTPDDIGSLQPTDRHTAPTGDDPTRAVSDQDPATNLPADDAYDDAATGLLPTGVAVAGLGILAAGLVALIDRLRRIQLQHRRPATIPTPPPESAVGVETTLRSAAALTGTELVDVALRALGRHTLSSHTPAPHVAGVHITDSELRVLLWTPNPYAPHGWVSEDGDASWVLPTSTDLTHLHLEADGTAAPYPTLVTAGHSDDGQLLVDLEFIGALSVAGSPDDVAAACYTIATELAVSPLADVVEVICVGFGHDLAELERIRVVDRLEPALLDNLESTAKLLDETPNRSLLEGRMGPGGDSWYPVVVIDPAATAPEGANRLLAAAMSGRSVAAVVGYPTNDRWRFEIEDSTVRIEPLDFTLSRRDLTPIEQDGVADLIVAAKDLNGVPSDQMTTQFVANLNGASPNPAAEQAVLFTEEAPADAGTVEVRVLGTVSVEGARLPGRRSAELCTYLAVHRDGVEGDRVMEALWPDEPPNYKRLNRTVSDTRVNLGTGPDGEPYLSNTRTTGGLYRMSPHFGCDLTTFTDHTAKAEHTDGDEAVGHLQAALELVKGTPFSGITGGYSWVWAEGLYSFSVVAVDDAAHRLSELALDRDDPDLATWAARQGLLGAAACETCYRNLMRAAVAEDNQVALEAVFNELLAVVDEDDGPDSMDFLDPATVEFYERHSRRHRRRRGR